MRHKLSVLARSGSGRARGRVVIISGSFGAGHDAAAKAIAARLTEAGYTAEITDIVKLMSRPLGRSLQAAYLKQVQLAPSVYRYLLRYGNRSEGMNKVIIKTMRHTGDALAGIADHDPAAIVSTHPFASQALGELRAQGDLRVPVVTYLTDMSVHRAWVHPAVDVHLALHDLPAQQAIDLGAPLTRVVRPAVPERFFAKPFVHRSRTHCRQVLDLPPDQPLVAMTGGSMGMGSTGPRRRGDRGDRDRSARRALWAQQAAVQAAAQQQLGDRPRLDQRHPDAADRGRRGGAERRRLRLSGGAGRGQADGDVPLHLRAWRDQRHSAGQGRHRALDPHPRRARTPAP